MPPQQVALADQPDQAILGVDHWHAADVAGQQQLRDLLDAEARRDGDDVGGHDVFGQHRFSPFGLGAAHAEKYS